MLPPGMVQEHFSLAAGRPVLTFSAKLTVDGDILETKITPSRIHNVTFVEPETIIKQLVPESICYSQSTRQYVVGHISPPESRSRDVIMTQELSPLQVEKLKKIHELSTARYEKSVLSDKKEGHWNLMGAAISVQAHAEAQVYYTQSELPWRRVFRRIEGDPTISLTSSGFEPDFSKETRLLVQAKSLTSNVMQLACCVAGSWCASRGIPNIFRGTEPLPFDTSDLAHRLGDLDNDMESNPSRAFLTLLDYVRSKYFGTCSPEPIQHGMLGVDAYIKTTSPLRRYSDMISHWQIQYALLEEAELGRVLGPSDNPELAFSKQRLAKLLPNLQSRERLIRYAKASANQHWTTQLLSRMLHYGEGQPPLPEFLHGFVSGSFRGHWRFMFKELHLPLHFDIINKEEFDSDIAVGDWWVVKLEGVHAFRKALKVKLVERVSRMDG